MGQKVNPIGLRIGITRGWDSIWFSQSDYKRIFMKILRSVNSFRIVLAMQVLLKW
ncbi:30S ribosomal protein S3 domain protein [Leptospira interrogans serovar Bataviae str. HAI135]|nr:30S ribosomal protein S3 domain protein [Leptospira interrogans serovar Bataviae str. HAI135]